MRPEFNLFSFAHLAALAVVFLVTAAGVLLARQITSELVQTRLQRSIGLLIAGLIAVHLFILGAIGELHLMDLLPLHLCDFALFVAVYVSFTGSRRVGEVLFFWACTGTLLAMVTPALWSGFPHWRFFDYFILHGLVFFAACIHVLGFRRYPAPHAWLRAFVATNIYAGIVGAVNVVLKTNYLFLCRKPSASTLLDYFGPWPVYIVVCEVLALGLFVLLYQAVLRFQRLD